MNKKILTTLTVVACFIVFFSGQAFSAWTQPKNSAYNQLTISHYKTTKKFASFGTDRSGEVTQLHTGIHRMETEEFESLKITYYSEYGITDHLTVILSVPYDWQRSNDTMRYAGEDGPSGIGDINFGFRHSLIDDIAGTGILMSVQAEVKIPEAYRYDNPLTDLSLGDGQYDATLSLLFGRGLGKGYAWLNAGYKYRFENDEHDPLTFKPSDQLKISFGGGYAVTSWLSIRALIDWTKSIGNADVSDELIVANYATGGLSYQRDVMLIKDTLGLEPNILSAGIDLAFNVSDIIPILKDTFPYKEIVLSYNQELDGFGDLRTKDFALGQTYSIAFVFPGEGIFPINLFKK
jgi:hypothetical protein